MKIDVLAPVWRDEKETIKRVAVYARVSSERDAAEESLERQVEVFVEQIHATPGWELADTYVDRAISGTRTDRPEFLRLLEDCRVGKIDVILTKSFTRFARNTVVLLETLRELKSLGVNVIFEKDHIRSMDETGELLITLIAAFAQAESESASENQRWRIKKLYEQGLMAGGYSLYGYQLENGQFKIVPEEAEVVRMVYADYLSGMGTLRIAKKLNQMGILTRKGKHWSRVTVRDMLCNEKYIGDMLLQKTYIENCLTKKKVDNHGERTMYYVENNHEPIIPKAMQEAVKAEAARRADEVKRSIKNHGISKGLFNGILICDSCGARFRRSKYMPGTPYEKPIWSCGKSVKIGKEYCSNPRISENILINKTKEVLGTDDLESALPEQVSRITAAPGGTLVFTLKNGETKETHWENPSRRDSWTPEMRQKAREKTLERNRKKQIEKEKK